MTGRQLDRNRLRKLLGMLGSAHDGEALNAARHIDAMVKAAGCRWEDLIPAAPVPPADTDDLARIEQLLGAAAVSDILKLRLRAMRQALRQGIIAPNDRHFLRILHRKAVIDGSIPET